MKIDDKVLEGVQQAILDELRWQGSSSYGCHFDEIPRIAQAAITAYLKETQPTAETNYTIKSNSSNGESK